MLQFVFFYHDITHTIEQQNPDDPKLIQILPILVKISERFLKEKVVRGKTVLTKYQEFALFYYKWLYCGNEKCKSCPERKEKWTSSVKNSHTNITDSPLLQRVILSFNNLLSNDLFLSTDGSENMLEFKDDIVEKFREIEQHIFFKFQSEKQDWGYG